MKDKIFNIIARIFHLIIGISPVFGAINNTKQGLYEPVELALCLSAISLPFFVLSFFRKNYSEERDTYLTIAFGALAIYHSLLVYWNDGSPFYLFPIPILCLTVALIFTRAIPFIVAYSSIVLLNLIAIFTSNADIENLLFIIQISMIGFLVIALAKLGFIKTQQDLKKKRKELVESYKILKKTTFNLEESNQRLEEFAYITSHDLKTPIRGIKNLLNFTLEDHEEEMPQEAIENIKKADQLLIRMNNLTERLLEYSRVDMVDLSIKKLDLNRLMQKMPERFDRDNVSIEFQNLPSVNADESRLEEVFYNLISNAIKYNDSEIKHIKVVYDEKSKLLSFNDNGIGIAEEDYGKVFKFFSRLHAQNEYEGGTGAGMALVKRILDRHDIEISIESEIGTGTTFHLNLSKCLVN